MKRRNKDDVDIYASSVIVDHSLIHFAFVIISHVIETEKYTDMDNH